MDNMREINDKWHLRFAITGRCNFRCKYCNMHGKTSYIEDMPLHEVKEILQGAYANGIRRVHFTGGEPFIRKDFLKILAIAKDVGFNDEIVTTNGFMLHKVLDRCIENGLTRAIISLDSMSDERNTNITGVNFFKETKKSIEAATEKLSSTTKVSCVTMKSMLKELPEFIQYIQEINKRENAGKLILKLNQFHPDNEAQLHKEGQDYWVKEYVSDKEIFSALGKFGELKRISNMVGDNPSYQYYTVGNTGVIVGVLCMMSWNFPCGKCFKLRAQPSGKIMVCKNYQKSPGLIGKTLKEKTRIISDWMNYRELKIDKEMPNRIHYNSQLGEERWGKVDNPKSKNFFINYLKKEGKPNI
ncbi:MAG: radical SAM protein [Candidatus Aenigmarchaeota archaeon]|nr:radical SAM protein [Candidatus Aenigmarchaeota archaeon]